MSKRRELLRYVQLLGPPVSAADNQTQDNVPIPVGPDGWPIDLESATTSPGEESQVSF